MAATALRRPPPRITPLAALLLAGLALLALSAGSALAQVRWTDDQGRVHYGDQAPPGVKGAPVRGRLSNVTGGADATSSADQEKAFQKRQRDAETVEQQRQKDAAIADERARACTAARGALAALDAGGRAVRYTPEGERVVLDEAGVAAERTDTLKAIEASCGPAPVTPPAASPSAAPPPAAPAR